MICKNTLTQNGIFQAICQAKHPLPFQRYFISLIGQTEIFNISTRTRAELYYPAFAFSGLPALSALNGEVFVFVRNGGNGRDTDAPIINAIFSAQEDYEQGMCRQTRFYTQKRGSKLHVPAGGAKGGTGSNARVTSSSPK